MFYKRLILLLALVVFSACSGKHINDYAGKKPELIPQEFFNGTLQAKGVIKNRDGQVTKRFTGKFTCEWDANGVGKIHEYFEYTDGDIMQRTWTITPTGEDKTFRGTAEDVVGDAKIVAKGNTIMMDYTMSVPYEGSTIDVNVQNWLHLQNDVIILNHSQMTKLGFKVAEMEISITK